MKYLAMAAMAALSILFVNGYAIASFENGLKAYLNRDYTRAYREFRADESPSSLYNIGIMYYKGEGVKVNRQEAAQWFRKAAEQGHMNAQFILGTMYDKGEDLPLDRREAANWYRKAAEQGHRQAQFNLGIMLTSGDGVEKDRKEAIAWLKRAASQGHMNAMKLLHVMGVHYDPR